MFEKCSPKHADKIADRIAGAVVDLCYNQSRGGWMTGNPRVAVEVLIGHGEVLVIIETSEPLYGPDVLDIVRRISGIEHCTVKIVPQDPHLARNQEGSPRVGDNGICRGVPVTTEQRELTALMRSLDETFHSDAKAVLTNDRLIVCQSNAGYDEVYERILSFVEQNDAGHALIGDMPGYQIEINPLGPWTGGLDVDSGAVNRKLGSDMGDAVSGGGLHGKDLSKFDVTGNIVAHMLAQKHQREVTCAVAIGDYLLRFRVGDKVIELPYTVAIEQARQYIYNQFGSFEKFAEYGLIS